MHLANGLNVKDGKIVYQAVVDAIGEKPEGDAFETDLHWWPVASLLLFYYKYLFQNQVIKNACWPATLLDLGSSV